MNAVQKDFVASALNATRLRLTAMAGQLVIETLNGHAFGSRAFVAHVSFRDRKGILILPPYSDFSHLPDGFYGFKVIGGSADAPITTRHYFTAPPSAYYIEVALRRHQCPERPVVSREPVFEADSQRPATFYQFAMTEDVTAIACAVANGKAAGTKAFVAHVRFLDNQRAEIEPPHAGFAYSPIIGTYFYLAGGTPANAITTTHAFTPPPSAVTMEMELYPWAMKQAIALTAPPEIIRRESAAKPVKSTSSAIASSAGDYLNMHMATAPIGSQILSETITAAPIVGIMGPATCKTLGKQVVEHALPMDRYDVHWQRHKPGYLLLEADALPQHFGWKYALTLHDPSATVELAVMLQKARAFGMRTVLISPTESHRFPLLSRISDLFDVTLSPGAPISFDA